MTRSEIRNTSQLPPECIDNIIRLLRNDMKTLYNISLANHSWCNIALIYLYKDPWRYFPYDDWGYPGQTKRISILLSTLLSPLDTLDYTNNNPKQAHTLPVIQKQKYFQLLSTLELAWLKRALRLVSIKGFGESFESLNFDKYWKSGEKLLLHMLERKPRQLRKLNLMDCRVLDTIDPSEISLVSLTSLDIRQRIFNSSTAKKIHQLCPNLVQLKVTALLVDDVATAKLIERMKQNTLNKICINGTMKTINSITHALIKCHRESLEEFSINMNPGNIQEDVVDPSVNSGILELSQLPNLKALTLKGMFVNTELVMNTAQQCAHLSRVHLSGPYVATGAAEVLIIKLGRRLLELTLNIEERCLGRTLLLLSKHCPNLRILDIAGMEFDCAQITKLSMACSELTHIVLGHPLYAPTKMYNGMLEALTINCHKLEYLNLNRVYVGPQIVRNLLDHSNLKKLVLPLPLLHSPSFSHEVIQFKTVVLGEQGVFELYIKPI